MAKRPTLRPDIPLDEALPAAMRDILMKARDAIADPGKKTDEAVHDFRRAIKRWRSFLRLIEPRFGEGADNLRASAREIAKKLAGARDLRSTLDAIEDLGKSTQELNGQALKTASGRIAEMQAAAEQREITPSGREEIAQEVSRWLTTVSLWPFSGIRFEEISESLTSGYRRARRAMPERWEEAGDDELHKFRRRTIDCRYQMELIEPLWPRMAKLWIDEAQRLRDALGKHRDLALLRAITAPEQPLADLRSELMQAIAGRQQEHLAQAAKLASRVYADKPRAFQARLDRLWHAAGGE